MSGTKFVEVTITAVMEVNEGTTAETLKSVVPQAVFEAFWTQIQRSADVEVLSVEDVEYTEVEEALS